MRESDIDCPKIIDWLSTNVQGLVGVNPEMFSVNDFAEWNAQVQLKSIDLIRPLWTEGRPAIPADKLYPYSADFAGETVESKLARMREQLAAKKGDALIISALDEIAWLLNIRGNDVEYNPVVISYAVLEADKCTLFVDHAKLDSAAQNYLDFNRIDVQPYEAVFEYIRSLNGTLLYDGAKVNEALFEAIPEGCKKINTKSPILIDKAKKAGVKMTPAGSTWPYHNDPHDSNIRVAPTYPPLEDLKTAAKLFSVCVKLVSAQKLYEAAKEQ